MSQKLNTRTRGNYQRPLNASFSTSICSSIFTPKYFDVVMSESCCKPILAALMPFSLYRHHSIGFTQAVRSYCDSLTSTLSFLLSGFVFLFKRPLNASA